jgi:magnesium chelatase family protein
MQAVVDTFTLCGIEALPVEVQVSVDPGYPTTTIVGLPDKAVKESLDRIFAAYHSSGFSRPDRRVTVNLAPAELRKEGSSFDLAIALGILAALQVVPPAGLAGLPVAGELALNGEVRPVRGALAMALAASRLGRRRLLLPPENAAEASDVPGLEIRALRTLADAVARFRDGLWDAPGAMPATAAVDVDVRAAPDTEDGADFAEVRGQAAAKRALEVSAAGGHNLLMVGTPGTGKTLLAQRLPTILPTLSRAEAQEVTLVHSVAGLLHPGVARIRQRPFRAPHHTVTGPGLVGGGAIPKPGEISLAHCGVLFLDEMAEFRPQVLNLLRQPLEDGWVRLVRSGRVVTFPSRFMLVGAMNPWSCVALL